VHLQVLIKIQDHSSFAWIKFCLCLDSILG